MTTVYEVLYDVISTLKRAQVTDTGQYAVALADIVCRSLEENTNEEQLVRRMKHLPKSDLLNPKRISIDTLLETLADRYHGLECTATNHSKPNIDILLMPKSRFSAYRNVLSLIRNSTDYLYVMDRYPGEATLIAVNEAPTGVTVKLLTAPPNGKRERALFESLARRLMSDRTEIEIRYDQANLFHDRYIMTKNASWKLGHSIKDIGAKLSSISANPDNVTRSLVSEFVNYWGKALRL